MTQKRTFKPNKTPLNNPKQKTKTEIKNTDNNKRTKQTNQTKKTKKNTSNKTPDKPTNKSTEQKKKKKKRLIILRHKTGLGTSNSKPQAWATETCLTNTVKYTCVFLTFQLFFLLLGCADKNSQSMTLSQRKF